MHIVQSGVKCDLQGKVLALSDNKGAQAFLGGRKPCLSSSGSLKSQ